MNSFPKSVLITVHYFLRNNLVEPNVSTLLSVLEKMNDYRYWRRSLDNKFVYLELLSSPFPLS